MFTQTEIYRRWEKHVEECQEYGQESMSYEEFASGFYDLWEV